VRHSPMKPAEFRPSIQSFDIHLRRTPGLAAGAKKIDERCNVSFGIAII
jgi:hypothetical protein